MQKNSNNEMDRRRADRYQWLRFESHVKVRRSLFKKEWIGVVPFDFSRYGMGIQTDEQFEVGQEVCLSLELARNVGEIRVPELSGLVRYKEKHHSRFNYGVEFVFRSSAEKNVIEESLIQIEAALRKFESERCRDQAEVANSRA